MAVREATLPSISAAASCIPASYFHLQRWRRCMVAPSQHRVVADFVPCRAPTAGGPYHWASEFAHPKAQQLLSYLAGWLLTLSWLCGVTSGMFLTGQMVQYTIVISDFNFDAQPWQCWLLVVAFTALGVVVNTVGAKRLALFELVAAGLFTAAFIVNLTVFCSMGPHNSAKQVFGTFENGGHWSNFGFGILTSQTAALYLLIGSDGAAHMAEETENASISVPRGIIGSYTVNAATGLVMLITFCFCYTPQALASEVYAATDFAFMAVYKTTTGSAGGAQAMVAIIIVLTFCSGATFMASASRQTYAFARDGGVPFSKWVCKVKAQSFISRNPNALTMARSILASKFQSSPSLSPFSSSYYSRLSRSAATSLLTPSSRCSYSRSSPRTKWQSVH